METIRLTTAQAIVKFLDQQYVSRDGVETKFVEAFFTLFGHGIAVGLGEALDTNPGGIKVMQGRRVTARRSSPAPAPSAPARRTWSPPAAPRR